jgi:hypothetical protein
MMLTKTKIAFAATLILGTASAAMAGSANTEHRGGFVTNASKAAHAGKSGKASARARESYARDYVSSSPSTKPTGAVRPFSDFERRWFDYQADRG